MKTLKIGDIVCLKKSKKLVYKQYYVITGHKEDNVMYVRCEPTGMAHFVYVSPEKHLALCKRCTIELFQYIQKQLDRNEQNIEDELPFFLYLKVTKNVADLLNNEYDILTIMDRERKMYTYYELKETKIVKTDTYYKIENMKTNMYVKVMLERRFYECKGK